MPWHFVEVLSIGLESTEFIKHSEHKVYQKFVNNLQQKCTKSVKKKCEKKVYGQYTNCLPKVYIKFTNSTQQVYKSYFKIVQK